MSAEANPFYDPLMTFWGRLNFVSGLLSLLTNCLDNYGKLLRGTLNKDGKDLSWMMSGKSIPLTDLTGPTDNGWLYHYASGSFSAKGEEYLRMADVIVRRESAWAVAQGYEAFETFLKDSLAAFFLHTPSAADQNRLRDSDKRAMCSCDRSRISYWRQFARAAYRGRNNQELLKALRRCAPGLAHAERDNTRGIDLVKWYAAAAAARHAVTHAHLRIRANASAHIAPGDNVFFPCKTEDGERILNLTEEHADKCLETFAEYAFQVFKYLSKATNDEWDILGKGFKPGKVKV